MRNMVLLMFVLLSACSQEQVSDYCNKHTDVHAGHLSDVAQLKVHYNGTGELLAEVSLPKTALAGNVEVLRSVEKVLVVKSQSACALEALELADGGDESDNVVASYRFDCGASNTLKSVDIQLLEYFPELDEVEANVETHAVNKHFVISRQCQKPIFSL